MVYGVIVLIMDRRSRRRATGPRPLTVAGLAIAWNETGIGSGRLPVGGVARRHVPRSEAMTLPRRLLALAILIGLCLDSSPGMVRPPMPRLSGRPGERSCHLVRKPTRMRA